jgi:hypothetical protein
VQAVQHVDKIGGRTKRVSKENRKQKTRNEAWPTTLDISLFIRKSGAGSSFLGKDEIQLWFENG